MKARISYLLLTWLITSYILAKFAELLFPLIPETNFYREFFICGGQMIFQGVAVAILNRHRILEYLVNLMTISFWGALLLLIPLALQNYLTPIIAAAGFAAVVFLMFCAHVWRTKCLGLSWPMTFSWVMYRVIVLAVIL